MTIIKHSNQRVGVLIDAQNLYHSAQNLYGQRVNFTKVLEEAVAGRTLIRAVAYVITSESGEESSFFEALEQAGIETKAKDLQVFSGGAKKADWDVGLAVDAIKLSHSLDALVIASGDGDFIPAIQYVQHATGCQVEVISFGRSTSSALIEVADDFVDMCEERETYLMASRIARKHNRRKFGTRGSSRVRNGQNNDAQKDDQSEKTEQKVKPQDLLKVEETKPDTSKPRVSVSREKKASTPKKKAPLKRESAKKQLNDAKGASTKSTAKKKAPARSKKESTAKKEVKKDTASKKITKTSTRKTTKKKSDATEKK